MRAHNALDLLARTRFGKNLHLLAMENQKAKSLLERAVTFEFGEIRPEPEHTEFGLDLLSRRMLRLPFPTVFFSCGVGHFVCHMAKEGGPLYVASLTTQENLACVGTQVTILGHYPDDLEAKWKHISKSVPCHIGGSISDDQAGAEACLSAHIVSGLLALLLGRDVEKVHRPAPPALNKRRKRKGRPLINAAYEIKIRPHVVINTDGTGRTHASPTVHWRRGYLRRLGERLIPVAPCLVGASESAELVLPNPRDYIVPSNVGWQRTRSD